MLVLLNPSLITLSPIVLQLSKLRKQASNFCQGINLLLFCVHGRVNRLTRINFLNSYLHVHLVPLLKL